MGKEYSPLGIPLYFLVLKKPPLVPLKGLCRFGHHKCNLDNLEI